MARTTPDFFRAQGAARLRTALLLAWFAIALVVLVLLFYVGAALPLFVAREGSVTFHARLLAFVAVGVLGTTGAGCVYQSLKLARGGAAAVVEGVGATRLEAGTQDVGERRLVNVVEEMAIASGVPIPQVYVLRDEPGINALAAGWATRGAVVAVTAGAVQHLTRDELQAVVAHEFGHLLNGDAVLNARLLGLVGGLSVLDLFGREALDAALASGRHDWRIGIVGLPSGIVLAIAGWAGLACGQVVRAGVSRQREYLADAAAAQFTRNPHALASALAKIRDRGSALQHARAVETSHFFFANALDGVFARWMQTHPPIEERIRRLDPALLVPSDVGGAPTPAPAPLDVVAPVRTPGPEHLAHASQLLGSLPAAISAAAHGAQDAPALLLALACDGRGVGDGGVGRCVAAAPPELQDRVAALVPAVLAMSRAQRLCAADLALASLDGLDPARLDALRGSLEQVARQDGHLTAFEWMLVSLVRHRLEQGRARRRPGPVRFDAVEQVEVECLQLLSLVAWSGSRDGGRADAALAAGIAELGVHGPWRVLPREKLGAAVADAALRTLAQGSTRLKERILRACAATAFVDGEVTSAEAELLRVVAASLDRPLLPVLPGALSPDSVHSREWRTVMPK